MYHSPRTRRLRNDLAALERLRADSSVFRFYATGDPPQQYHILFSGKGLWRDRSKVKTLEHHRVEIKLGTSYPRNMPEIRWVTPVYHPNISEIGMVCLGGYGTHWVPSLQLDELCIMLWDMVRYHNYDIRSPYNREAALWVAGQTTFRFPTDTRPLRDKRASLGRAAPDREPAAPASDSSRRGASRSRRPAGRANDSTPVARVLQFIDRYGLIFGNGDSAGSMRGNDHVAAVQSHLASLREFGNRSSEPCTTETVAPSEHADREVGCAQRLESGNTDSETARTEEEAHVGTATATGTDHAGRDAERDDLIILESRAGEAESPSPLAGGDEIIFIE
jgi:ubiquitin-protein ligase